MKFEVGKSYFCYGGSGYDPIKILRRTAKTVWVDKDGVKWKMRVRTGEDGNEYVTDSSVPLNWRDEFTYCAKWVKNEPSVEWKPVLQSLEWETVGSYARSNCPPLPVWEAVLWERHGVKQLCRVSYREGEKKFMVYFDTGEDTEDGSAFLRGRVLHADNYWEAHKQYYHTEFVDYEDIAKAIERFKENVYASTYD